MSRHRQKGDVESRFLLAFAVFFVVLSYLTGQISSYGVEPITLVDFGVIGVSLITIGVGCTVIGGIGCVATSIIGGVISLITVPQFYSIIFVPLLFVYAYIIAKLARGS